MIRTSGIGPSRPCLKNSCPQCPESGQTRTDANDPERSSVALPLMPLRATRGGAASRTLGYTARPIRIGGWPSKRDTIDTNGHLTEWGTYETFRPEVAFGERH